MKDRKEQLFTRTPVVWLGAMLCCALWGSAFPSIKIGYELMKIASEDTAAQILYAGCRFFLAGILVVVFGSIGSRKVLIPRRDELAPIMLLSLFQTILQYFFFYVGLAHTSGVKASIIVGTNVFISVLVAGVLFRMEQVTARKMIGCVIGFLGVIVINVWGSGLEGGIVWNGEGFIFLSAVSYAFSSAIIKKFSKTHNPVLFSGYQFMFGGAVMAIAGYALGGTLHTDHPAGAIAMLMYLAAVSAAAYTIWSILLKYNPVSKVAVFGFMNPVFGVILSAVFLHEGNLLSPGSIVALILVCAGIYIVNRR